VKEEDSARIPPYELRIGGTEHAPAAVGQPYNSTRVVLNVFKGGQEIASLDPEKRHYPPTGFRPDSRATTEVKIRKEPWQDFYVYFQDEASGGYVFTVFRTPMINLIWLGWVVMIAGGVWAALPFARRRVGLAG